MTVTDACQVIDMLKALNSDLHAAEAHIFDGDPPSKQRVRFNGRHAYTPTALRLAEEARRVELRAHGVEPMLGNVAVAFVFYRQKRQRIDVDNLVKFALDAANKLCWLDDVQVTGLLAVIEHDPERPRTVMGIARHESSMLRGEDAWVPCGNCGEPFDTKSQPIKFCSPECRTEARGIDLSGEIACLQCGDMFRRNTSAQKLCSQDCRIEWLRGRHRARRQDPRCVECGGPVTKVGYVRCRACWSQAPGGVHVLGTSKEAA